MSINSNLRAINYQTALRSKPVRDNFSEIQSDLNNLQTQISALTTAASGSEVVNARDYAVDLGTRITEEGKLLGNCVISGLVVSEQTVPDMTIKCSSGFALVKGTVAYKSAVTNSGTLTAPTPLDTLLITYRYDIVVIDNSNLISVIAGTPSLAPILPTISNTQRPLALLKISENTTSITSAIITDIQQQGCLINGNWFFAIQDAVDFAEGQIIIRTGEYYEEVDLTGRNNTTLFYEAGAKHYRPANLDRCIISENSFGYEVTNTKIIGGEFYGNGKTGAIELIKITYCNNLIIDNVIVDGNTLSTADNKNIYIENCNNVQSCRLTILVTGTSYQMASGCDYIPDNVGIVFLTLPEYFEVGDEIGIIGKGTGGWTVLQYAGQQIILTDATNQETLEGTDGRLNSVLPGTTINLKAIEKNTKFRVYGKLGILSFSSNWYGTGADGDYKGAAPAAYTQPAGADADAMIVKNYGNLHIESGDVTVADPGKGLLLYCTGDLTVDAGAKITMSAKGKGSVSAVPSGGLIIARIKSGETETGDSDLTGTDLGTAQEAINSEANQSTLAANGKLYHVEKVGGIGGTGGGTTGTNGGTLTDSSGGGAEGGAGSGPGYAGADGSCFWGGGGGGGGAVSLGGGPGVNSAGGQGGNSDSADYGAGGGGSGNPVGAAGGGSGGHPGSPGVVGPGGLILIIVRGNVNIQGTIESNGNNGGNGAAGRYGGGGGGGGSGGGVVKILHGGTYTLGGSITVNGGSGGVWGGGGGAYGGGDGGDGSIEVDQIDQ